MQFASLLRKAQTNKKEPGVLKIPGSFYLCARRRLAIQKVVERLLGNAVVRTQLLGLDLTALNHRHDVGLAHLGVRRSFLWRHHIGSRTTARRCRCLWRGLSRRLLRLRERTRHHLAHAQARAATAT